MAGILISENDTPVEKDYVVSCAVCGSSMTLSQNLFSVLFSSPELTFQKDRQTDVGHCGQYRNSHIFLLFFQNQKANIKHGKGDSS